MDNDPINTFDSIYTYPQIQVLKIALIYLPANLASLYAIYIKFLELKYTISLQKFLNNSSNLNLNQNPSNDISETLMDFTRQIEPYLDETGKEFFKRIENIVSSLNKFEELKPFMDLIMNMQNNASNDYDMFKTFLDDEQIDLFQKYMNYEL